MTNVKNNIISEGLKLHLALYTPESVKALGLPETLCTITKLATSLHALFGRKVRDVREIMDVSE